MINLNFNKVYKEVKDIIPKKTTLPKTQRVYFLEGNLWVTDTERALKVKMFEAGGNKNFSISFEDIKRLKTIKNGIVDIDSKTVAEKGTVYSIDISTDEEDIFEMWNRAEKEIESKCETATYKHFNQVLKCIYPFVDIKSSNGIYKYIHIKGDAIEGTNGHKLIKAEIADNLNGLDTILSGMAFNTLKNLPEEEVKVKDSNKFVTVESGSWKYFEWKKEFKYPNFENMFVNILDMIESKISLDIASFKEKLENVKKSKKPFVVVITKENEIYSICDNNVSKLEGEVVKETKSEKSLFVAFNPSYMLDIIKVKKANYEDKIELNLTNYKSPIYVESNDGYINYYMALLPINIGNGNNHIETYNEQIKIIEKFKDSIKFDEDVVKETAKEDVEAGDIETEDVETEKEDVETVKETTTKTETEETEKETEETVKEDIVTKKENVEKEDIVKIKPDTKQNATKKIKILDGLEIEYTKTEEKHTRTQEKLFCVRIKTSLSRNEYIDIAALFRKLGGYYSKFKHAFIFKENIQLEDKLREV